MTRLGQLFSLVKFGHSVFALPFALQGAWLAAGGVPRFATLGLIVVCAVAARTAAMAFNRVVDRDVDARNPRTRAREIPAGTVSVALASTLVAVASAVFVAAAFALGPLCGWLSIPVLVVLLAYSYVKRFSSLAHAVLGLALAIAPVGAWIAVRGSLGAEAVPVWWLALAVWSWVFGFDLIYACQDASFDAEQGLHSIPSRFGIRRALGLSSLLHVVTVAALVATGLTAELAWIWWVAVVATALLLVWEHRLVGPDDLSRVDVAFFTINGWVGVGLFVGLVLDRGILGAGA